MSRTRTRSSTRLQAAAFAVALVVLPGCTPAGQNEACDSIQVFSASVRGARNYAEIAQLTSRLSDELNAAALGTGNRVLRSDIRFAATAARDVTTVIRSRQSSRVIESEIEVLVYALNEMRISYCNRY
jgi:hypothetical protein